MRIMSVIAMVTLAAIGGLLTLWSLICFLGGPDGRIGSAESVVFGLLFLFAGLVFAFLAFLCKRKLR